MTEAIQGGPLGKGVEISIPFRRIEDLPIHPDSRDDILLRWILNPKSDDPNWLVQARENWNAQWGSGGP